MRFSTLGICNLIGLLLLTGSASASSYDGGSDVLLPFVSLLENREIQLLHVTSNALKGYEDIRVYVDGDSNVISLREVSDHGQVLEFNLDQLAQGAVLFRQSGRDVVKLVAGPGANPTSGGDMSVVYLYSGITSSFRSYPIEVARLGDQWFVQVNDQGGRRTISEMYLKGHFLLGKAIGIEGVTVN